MKKWTSKQLRTAYLKFFESKGHLIGKSDSLVPDDKSLLYTSAGMVQFKPYFMGERVPPCTRITTSQKCMRTDDIDEVGDAVHHTFFEMLGNFSFGDYFKAEVIPWAWEFLTKVLKLNPENLWTSVYKEDDEAYDIWTKVLGFPKERIVRLDADKNYWPANAPLEGPNGVCGPCNEIFLDVDPSKGYPKDPAWSIAHDSNRFVEIWNLVFTQFDRKEGGELVPLPFKNIDTGMGLERTVAVLNGYASNYDTDLFMPIIDKISELSGKKYGKKASDDKCFRVIADHIRSAVFVMCDGVLPSNTGRGYVLRRLIRNAAQKGLKLGLKDNFMVKIIPVVVDMMGDVYPELIEKQSLAEKVMSAEEEKFKATLEAGIERLENAIKSTKEMGIKKLAGEEAFTLYDTYGFPLELTIELCKEKNLDVNMDAFNKAMEKQKTRSKAAGNFADVMGSTVDSCFKEMEKKDISKTDFVGYTDLDWDSYVVAIIDKDKKLQNCATEGDNVQLVVEVTPFYAEMGGQVGDKGIIEGDEFFAEVVDTTQELGYYLHNTKIKKGNLNLGDKVTLKVDRIIRMGIQRNHTGTHILHYALEQVLGDHITQAGSYVNDKRLRFDYTHFEAPSQKQLERVETIVNNSIFDDIDVKTVETDIENARKLGAKALFGEKYGDTVRVVNMRNSKEFCGGTHVESTGQLGMFKIISETSVGAGLRRIEAITGRNILRYINSMTKEISQAEDILGAQKGHLVESAKKAVKDIEDYKAQIENLREDQVSSEISDIISRYVKINGYNYLAAYVPDKDVEELKMLVDKGIDQMGAGCVVIGSNYEDKVTFVAKCTKDLVKAGCHCGKLVKAAAAKCNGGGGGRPDFAQAGGKFTSLDDALEAFGAAKETFEQLTKK
ncbi:MAG: alanine--tRNA ligase [Abditibacteriota bacterium]|nr:alanine--tRNA ligase [Abditibacteriota bacterium]